MSLPVLTTVGGRTLTAGLPGQVADASLANINSFTNESATAVDYGRAVVRGATVSVDGPLTCKPMSADTDQVLGISVRNPLLPASTDGNNTVNYPRYTTVPVLDVGHVFVTAAEDVRAGDVVLALSASGGTLASSKGGVAGTGRVLVPGAIWETTTSSGAIGLVKIIGGEAGRTTT